MLISKIKIYGILSKLFRKYYSTNQLNAYRENSDVSFLSFWLVNGRVLKTLLNSYDLSKARGGCVQ